MNKGLTLRMNQCPVKRQWPRLFEHIRNGYFKPSDVITHHVPLEHIAEGYHMFSAKLDNCISPIVVPRRGVEEELVTYTQAPARRGQRRAAGADPRLGCRSRPRRPSVGTAKRFDPSFSGAHWEHPERQPEKWPRERSVEHTQLPPVFGTVPAQGPVRRHPYAYAKYSEGQAAHWLLLMAGDRVDAVESGLRSLLTLRPDNPITETGVLAPK